MEVPFLRVELSTLLKMYVATAEQNVVGAVGAECGWNRVSTLFSRLRYAILISGPFHKQ